MHDDSTVRVPLRARDGAIVGHTLVDAIDADFVNQWTWRLDADGYARRSCRIDGRTYVFLLHRELMGLTFGDKLEVDHIAPGWLSKRDNRRVNLRIVTHAQQMQNNCSHRGASSPYRGVGWNKSSGKWAAFIVVNRKQHHLGYFTDEAEAAAVAREARLRLLPYAVD